MKPVVCEGRKRISTARKIFRISAAAAMTYVALTLGHVHGVLHIRRSGHQVVYRLALFLLVFGLVHFLQYENKKTTGINAAMIKKV